MLSLQQIEEDLTAAMKAKDQTLVDTLRGLKTRVQNEKVAKVSRGAGSGSAGRDLSEEDIQQLVRSEIKRRKESAESFTKGMRADQAQKELKEASILEKYLPEPMSEQEIVAKIEEILSSNNFTAQDFGKAMGLVKSKLGSSADGATVARMLKERLG